MIIRSIMEPADYAGILLRRKWLVTFTVLVLMFAATAYCVVAKERYQSSTTILIVPARVSESYVRSTVNVSMQDRLATLRQQIMSRTRLLAIVDELGLFRDRRDKAHVQEVVEEMRNRIDLQVRRNDAFTISFVHESPNVAMLTAARLASSFIEENLKTRESQAVGTAEFLQSQLEGTKAKLEVQEAKVREYKTRFLGELPQETQTNLSVLSRLQDQFRTNADGLRAAEDRKVFLEAQLGTVERSGQAVIARQDEATGEIVFQDPASALVSELAVKRAHLADLSSKYTDRYPDVQKTRREVEALESRIAELRSSGAPADNKTARKSLPPRPLDARFAQTQEESRQLRRQVASTELEVAALRREKEDIRKSIAEFQSKVERAPAREQELISLTRDYENIKSLYNDLVRKKLDADISQNLEKHQRGEQFQILDPANLPEAPIRPNRGKIMAFALVASVFLAFGGAIGLEMMDTSIRDKKEFDHFFKVPVLASIPVIPDSRYRRRVALRRFAIAGGFVSFAIAVTAFLVIYADRVRVILRLTKGGA